MAERPMELLVIGVGGVLYRDDPERRVVALAEATGRPTAEVYEAVVTSGLEARADSGEVTAEEYLAALGEHLGIPVARRDWAAARAASLTPDDEVLSLVQRVSMDTPVASLANDGALMAEEAPRIVPELAALGRARMFFAGVLGVAKPHPAAYHTVLEAYGVAPEAAAFVDASPRHVAGAERVGLRTHLYEDRADLAVFLAALRLL